MIYYAYTNNLVRKLIMSTEFHSQTKEYIANYHSYLTIVLIKNRNIFKNEFIELIKI